VGRDQETASLEAALDQALAGTGQVVGIVGDAGVGKSRLCFEFVERSRARGMAVYEARCVSHGKMIPFLPILEMLRGYFGVAEQDRNEEARRKIAGTLLLLDEELTEALPLLFDFLGVPDPERPVQRMDPEARQRQLFAFVKRLIHARSRREPAVLLIEDLHWIDGGSEGFLAEAVEAVAGTRTLLLTNFRPEYRAGWMQRSHYRQLPLLPLRPEEVSEMLSHLLGRDSSLTGLTDHICGRTGGNPFFIEEVVQSLVETESIVGATGAYRLAKPVAKLVIPATVQAVLAARIDRLADREKAVLQTAAVIGKEVPQRVLAPVTELPETELAGALAALVRGEFLYEKALYPDAEYTFKHPLTQEVAYHSQLAARRARIHRAVAQTIADLSAHRLDESAALLAYHWEGAGEALEAARWHRRAGERHDRESVAQGLEHWLRVRTLLVQVPESAETAELVTRACSALLRGAGIAVAGVEEPASVFSHGRGLAERFGNTHALARLLHNYAVFKALAAGELGEAIELATEARNLEGDYSSSPVADLVWMLCASGRVREGLEVAERAVSATPKGEWVEGFLAHSWALYFRAFPLMYAGRAREAERDLEEAIEEAGRGGEPIVVGQAHGLRVHVATVTGEVEAALGHARRALEILEKSGGRFWHILGWWSLGEAHLLRGEWTDAATALERAVAITREIGIADPWEAWRFARLAEAYLGAGDLPRARKTAKFALDSARRRGTGLSEIAALLSLARVLLKSEGEPAHEAIHSALAQAQALVEETGATCYAPFIHVERAELARLTGDEAAHERELREAHRLFLEIGAPIRAAEVEKELDR
jgi:tetratricopeptide (TPR) repeat protein